MVLEDGYKTAPVDVRYETGQGKGAGVRVAMGTGGSVKFVKHVNSLGCLS
jgi:hypothetical protein